MSDEEKLSSILESCSRIHNMLEERRQRRAAIIRHFNKKVDTFLRASRNQESLTNPLYELLNLDLGDLQDEDIASFRRSDRRSDEMIAELVHAFNQLQHDREMEERNRIFNPDKLIELVKTHSKLCLSIRRELETTAIFRYRDYIIGKLIFINSILAHKVIAFLDNLGKLMVDAEKMILL